MFVLALVAGYMGVLASLIAGERRPLVYGVLIMTLCTDFLLIPATMDRTGWLVLVAKSWRELAIIAGFILFLVDRIQHKRTRIPGFILASILIVAVLTILTLFTQNRNASSLDFISGWRDYFLPFLLPISLYLSRSFRSVRPFGIYAAFLSIVSLMAVYSLYQAIIFKGDPRSVWFYYYVYDSKMLQNLAERQVVYQFIRDGHLRASGFLISAVDYSILSGFAAIFAFIGSWYLDSRLKRIFAGFAGFLCILGVELSHTRVGEVIMVLGLLVCVSRQILRVRRPSIYTAGMIAIVALVLSFVALNPGRFDASVAGRPWQFFATVREFRIFGWGFYPLITNGPTYKDSFYLSVVGTFGVASLFFVLLFGILQRQAFLGLRRLRRQDDRFTLSLGAVVSLAALWFVFGFQYTISGAGEYSVLLMAFAAIGSTLTTDCVKKRTQRRLPNDYQVLQQTGSA